MTLFMDRFYRPHAPMVTAAFPFAWLAADQD